MDLKKKYGEKILAYALKNAIEHEGKAQSGAILSPLFHEGLEKKDVKEIMPLINETLKRINSMKLEEQQKLFSKEEKQISHREEREGLPELPNVPKSGAIMRFAPSPSGPMHIGHAATGMPSSLYIKKYKGKFYIRIEDTNPENIDPESYNMIKEEADWLFGNVHEMIIQSDRIPRYYEFTEELIKKGYAYVCECNPEKFKDLLKSSKPCPCRSLSEKENLERWNKMLEKDKKKNYKEGEAVVLFKSDLKLDNPALRDFPLARINESKHPKQGNKYRVWPLMNLCVTVDDLDYKMTHIIRAKEHRDNSLRQAMIFKAIGKEKQIPWTGFLGRYNFTDLEISCSKTKALIKQGKYSGWDDIRLPFMAALRKRGYQPEAFQLMAEQRGLSEVDKVISKEDYFQVLSTFNKQIIKDKAKQASFEANNQNNTPMKSTGKSKKSINFKSDAPKSKVINNINQTNVEILMPDKTTVKGNSDLNLKSIKDEQIVYFSNLGYAQYNSKEKIKFWFGHP